MGFIVGAGGSVSWATQALVVSIIVVEVKMNLLGEMIFIGLKLPISLVNRGVTRHCSVRSDQELGSLTMSGAFKSLGSSLKRS